MEVDLLIIDEDDNVVINPSIRSLSPYRELFASDKGEKGDSKGVKKNRAKKELAWIFHMCDPRSPMYRRYRDSEERNIHVKKRLNLPDSWNPSDLVIKCGEVYQKDIYSLHLELLDAAADSVVDLKNYYKNLGTKVSDPKFDINKYMNSVGGLQELIKGIEDLKKAALQGIYEKSKIRGGGDVTYFEDPEN
jgi:hypothetical protein